mgnify:CR=1 FL=1
MIKTIDKFLAYRDEKGKILSRADLKKAKVFSDKVYEQAIGFMRIETKEKGATMERLTSHTKF